MRDGPPLERGFVSLGQDPYLVRCSRGVGTTSNKIPDRLDDAASLFDLLREDVAEDTTLFVAVVILAGTQFVQHAPRHKRGRREVRRRMCKILPRHRSMIL